MVTVYNTYIYNIYSAIRSIRNALQSWDKSDTKQVSHVFYPGAQGILDPTGIHTFNHGIIGDKDLELAKRLITRGGDERKFLRTIHVNCDITTTVNHWHEIDTYKVATTRNSTSTMHSLLNKEITQEDFDTPLDPIFLKGLNELLLEVKDLKSDGRTEEQRIKFKELKDCLPSGYLMMANYDTNYESLLGMYNKRKNHFLLSWIPIIKWIEKLPYFMEFYSALH